MSKILVLHGPNLNLLKTREPDIYGSTSLDEINQSLADQAKAAGLDCECYQSNAEHELVDKIQQSKDDVGFIVFNPGAFTHTSVALRDALLGVGIPFIEVHISNVYQRETFRHESYFRDIAVGVIAGLGAQGYSFALSNAITYLMR